jgi:hypothetical protein
MESRVGLEPMLGWRLWRLRPEGLESWAVNRCWQPGVNAAICLSSTPCRTSPGSACRCGFWALFSATHGLEYARHDRHERRTVLGLVRAWGEIAVHGEEGFRASHASVALLFTDWVWDADPDPRSRAERWWRAAVGLVGGPSSRHATTAGPDRDLLLANVARGYGVPALSLGDALRSGLLGELGVDTAQREEVRRLLERTPALGGRSSGRRPGDHGVGHAA